MSKIPDILLRYKWNAESLKASIRDKFECAYCDRKFMDDYDTHVMWVNDHILPKSKYPEYVDDPLNHVSACYSCNRIKGRFDPNHVAPVFKDGENLTQEIRRLLIDRARAHIVGKRDAWKVDREEMLASIEKYRAELAKQVRPSG